VWKIADVPIFIIVSKKSLLIFHKELHFVIFSFLALSFFTYKGYCILITSEQWDAASKASPFGWSRLCDSPAIVGLKGFDTSHLTHTSVLIEVVSSLAALI
jgi:hypothetical protein